MTQPIVPKELLTATLGGLSLLVVSGGADGQVLTQQADGTYAPEAVSAGIGGSVGSTTNRLVKSSGTGGSTVQSTGITVDASNNISGAGSIGCGGISSSSNSTFSGYVVAIGGLYVGNFDGSIVKSGSGASRKLDLCGVSIVRARNEANSADGPFSASSITASALICAGTYTVATLPSASANAYKFATVSDSSVTTFGTTVAGSGSSKVMVFSNGANWTVCAA